jgi:hypothetical protein
MSASRIEEVNFWIRLSPAENILMLPLMPPLAVMALAICAAARTTGSGACA